MEHAALERLNAHVRGARVDRVVRRPHEVRVYLRRDAEECAWLHFWPAADASVEHLLPGQAATHLSEDSAQDRSMVRIWNGGTPILEAVAASWSWHPYTTTDDEFLWQLTEAEKGAAHRAVDAVVARDAGALNRLAPPRARRIVDELWTWAHTQEGAPIRLSAPPGPFDDWEGDIQRLPNATHVGIELFDSERPDEPTDLTLEMELTPREDGGVAVAVIDLHVL